MKADYYTDRLSRRLKASIRRLSIAKSECAWGEENLQKVRKARKSYVHELRRIRVQFVMGEKEKVRRGCERMLVSYNAKLVSVVAAAHKRGLKLSFEECSAIASTIDFDKRCAEAAIVFAEEKASGGYRVVQKFGVEATSRQMIGRDLLVASTKGNKYDFATAGRGRAALRYNLLYAMGDGYHYWIEADIQSFFASLKPQHFDPLRLPQKLKKNTLLSTTTKLVPQGNQPVSSMELIKAAQSGLPEGAASSPFFASAFLGRELRTLMSKANVRLFTYVDNLFIGAREAWELETFAKALEEHFLMLKAGPLIIKSDEAQCLQEHTNLLGWSFSKTNSTEMGQISAMPSPRSFARLENNLHEKLNSTAVDALLDRATKYVEKWTESHFWTPAEEDQDYLSALALDAAETEFANRFYKPKYQKL